jgi:hypothetical protein
MGEALEEVQTNKIINLFDESFIKKTIAKRILRLYPEFKSVKKVKVIPIKKQIWQTTYHIVVEYETFFATKDNKKVILPIFCSAHSSDPRKCVHNILKYLWQHNFSKGYLTVPHPLFYSNYYKAVFYRGVKGNNLLYYIKQKDYVEIERIVAKTAAWLVKLHSLPTKGMSNFNEKINRLETVIPGKKRILGMTAISHPELLSEITAVYEKLVDRERKFFKSTTKRWLIHGDAHPENVIKAGRKKIAMIDFTDFCLSDFARDLGSFLQQLDYMCGRKTGDLEFTEKMKNLFLNTYLKLAKIRLSDSLQARIDTYYNWTAFRTAMFFLLKHNPDPERTKELLDLIKKNLELEPAFNDK